MTVFLLFLSFVKPDNNRTSQGLVGSALATAENEISNFL